MMYLNRIILVLLFLTSFSLSNLQAQCQQERFDFTGSEQLFVVPANVTEISITAVGAKGGNGYTGFGLTGGSGGLGSYVKGTIPVTPLEQLTIYVGGVGDNGNAGGAGGYNEGGSAGNADVRSGGGGGGTDIRQGGNALANRILIAGGGGGGGTIIGNSLDGGIGGILIGGNGIDGTATTGGQGGTQSAGGAGGTGGFSGNAGSIGQGANSPGTGGPPSGGGGGGGYYGGGSGGANDLDSDAAGGGGGSSLSAGTNQILIAGASQASGNGYVIIAYDCPVPTPICTGNDVTFDVSFTASCGTGTIEVLDGSTVIGSGTASPISVTISGPTSATNKTLIVRYQNNTACRETVNVDIPTCVAVAVPTMSAWSLFIFGLILLNLSIYLVQIAALST